MHKTIFFKVSWAGGARVFTVGLGVILAVMLGFAAATTTATPAAAQQDDDLLGPIMLLNRIEPYSFMPNDPTGEVDDGPPYRVPVQIFWRDWDPMVSWITRKCTMQPNWKIERQVFDGAWQVFRQGSDWQGGGGVDYLQANTPDQNRAVYRYRLTLTCHDGTTPQTATILGDRFWITVVEDPPVSISPNFFLGYSTDNWRMSTRGSPSGGTTHEARQRGAFALLRYEGVAAAWVTTVDDSYTPAEVVCDERRDRQGNWIPCAEVDTDDPDPGISGRYQRVAWSSWWLRYSFNQDHVVRVISEDYKDVDVDAFLVVHEA